MLGIKKKERITPLPRTLLSKTKAIVNAKTFAKIIDIMAKMRVNSQECKNCLS